MKVIWTILSIFFLGSCKTNERNLGIFIQDNLETQTFSVKTDQDTSLITKGGIIIQIKAGDIEVPSGNDIKFNVKEALTIADMVKAGLYTMSNGKPLSSGGMFSIEVEEGKEFKLKRAFSVYVPTTRYNNDMSIFSGLENEHRINWVNPEKLSENDVVQSKIQSGEILFQTNCGNCHKMDVDFTGPPMLGVTHRLPKRWLYDFTKNPASVWDHSASKTDNLLPIDNYTCCMVKKWRPIIMTPFPQLSDDDLDNIYSFIRSESEKVGFETEPTDISDCFVCSFPDGSTKKFDDDINSYFSLSRTIEVNLDTVIGTFYSLNIDSFGWYNIDIFLDDLKGCTPSELIVDIGRRPNENLNIALIIPSIQVFSYAYQVETSSNYVFSKDGRTIPLPRGEKCYILSYIQTGEESVEYSLQPFIAASSNIISTNWRNESLEDFLKVIDSLGLKDIKPDPQPNELTETLTNSTKQNGVVSKTRDSQECGCSTSL